LQAFSDKIGDKLCKRFKIDIDDTSSTAHVWSELKKEALNICTKDNSQMSKLWKTKKQLKSSPVKPIPKMREGQQPRLEEVGPTLSSRGRSGKNVDAFGNCLEICRKKTCYYPELACGRSE